MSFSTSTTDQSDTEDEDQNLTFTVDCDETEISTPEVMGLIFIWMVILPIIHDAYTEDFIFVNETVAFSSKP